MKIFIDSNYKCSVENEGAKQEIETDFFSGKCKSYIEGYRYIPEGATWVREDGVEFHGLMVTPFVDYTILMKIQEQYEKDQIASEDMQAALEILGVTE